MHHHAFSWKKYKSSDHRECRSALKQKNATAFGKVLFSIPRGDRNSEAVVDAARPEDSPIHDMFIWDDEEAAERYRCSQAAKYIRCLQVTVKSHGKDVTSRAVHSIVIEHEADEKNKGRRYLTVDEVLESQDARQQVIDQAMKELTGWRVRYSEYKDIFGVVFEAIDEAVDCLNNNGFKDRLAEVRRKKGIPEDIPYQQ